MLQPLKKTLTRVEGPAVALQTSPGPWHSMTAPSVPRNSDARRGCPKCTARCPRVSSTCWPTPRIGWGVPRRIPALRPLRILIEHGTAYSWPIHTVHTKWAESCRHNRRINNWGLTHSPEFPLFLDRKKMKTLLPLHEEGHTFSCTQKLEKNMWKNAFRPLKKATEPAAHPASTSRAGEETAPFGLEMAFLQRC